MPNLKNPEPNGIHYLIGFFGCDEKEINSVDFWKKVLPKSIDGTNMAILNSFFYKFEPQGVTGFLLLSSSHLSIHTWPENGYVACDIFTCAGEGDTRKVVDYLVENITHEKAEINKVRRGYMYC